MSDLAKRIVNLPGEQEAIRAKCFHPTGTFVQFKPEEVEQSIAQRFEKIVHIYPNRLAVKTQDHALTYDQLNRAANRVARAILDRRKERGNLVALLFEPGSQVVVAMLGALKAGKIYVPLDPSFPRTKIIRILKHSEATLIVTNSQNLALARESVEDGQSLINIDDLNASLPADNLGLSISADDLAYVLYTSGSTGEPKGVVHNHRNDLHDCMVYTNYLHFCASDRLTLLHSCSFSAARHNLFGALLNGGAIYPFDIKREGLARLSQWLREEQITVYHSGVVVYRHLLETLAANQNFPDLRLIKLGSQQVFRKDAEAYKRHFSAECILVNALSSTEASTLRWYLMDKETEITTDVVPVGYQVDDIEVMLLGDDGKDVGFDHSGEIAIRSSYLAPGYWNDPILSGRAFEPDAESASMRIYRTGDLGVMRRDGCLIHLGRKDFQVKIRGYRIDPGEVETALRELGAIKETIVVGSEDGSGEQRLVAYIVSGKQPAPTISELRSFLKQRLPDYMVPATFVLLDRLPLTPNGKVDRRALPAPDRSRPKLQENFVAPRAPIEQLLAEIWADVLNVERVGIHDNFFELGGHSLAATRLISRVIERFQLELPLKSLFEAPTVAAMATVITEHQEKELEGEKVKRVLTEVESLSDEEAQRVVSDEIYAVTGDAKGNHG